MPTPLSDYRSLNKKIQQQAQLGLDLHNRGYKGATETGLRRAQQLISGSISISTIRTMRNWFARHLYVSYPNSSRPLDKNLNNHRAKIAWLVWGGDAAYKWIQTKKIQTLLQKYYPDKDNTLPPLP